MADSLHPLHFRAMQYLFKSQLAAAISCKCMSHDCRFNRCFLCCAPAVPGATADGCWPPPQTCMVWLGPQPWTHSACNTGCSCVEKAPSTTGRKSSVKQKRCNATAAILSPNPECARVCVGGRGGEGSGGFLKGPTCKRSGCGSPPLPLASCSAQHAPQPSTTPYTALACCQLACCRCAGV